MTKDASRAAEALMAAHAAKERFRSYVEDFGLGGVDDAYAIQREYVRLQRQARSARPVGYKVGLTSKRMQEMCRIDSPIAGVVLDDRVHRSGATLALSDYGRLGVEFEIAVRLGSDLGRNGEAVTLDDVAAAVDGVAAAVEIVDDRNCDYTTLDVLSLISDNSWNAGVVLGSWRDLWPELAGLEGVASENGRRVDSGFGRDVLGHPFRSVAWLAEHLAAKGEGLKAGDFVMTGSIVTTKFPREPSHFRFELDALGAVELSVTAGPV